MNIFILIVGLIVCAVAISFLVKYYFLKADVLAIRATDTSDIADLRAMQSSIAKSIGRNGAWRERVEVKGLAIASRPLTAELSKIPCVYCHTVIKEEYERTEYDTDDGGDTNVRDVKGTKTISDRQTPFIISYRSESALVEQKQRLGRRKLLWGMALLHKSKLRRVET